MEIKQMKKLISFLSLIILLACANAQVSTITVDFDGIGDLKMGMTTTELEKLLQKKIVLKVINVDSVVLTETIQVNYKGIDYEIDLIKRYGESTSYIEVDGIATKSPLCKTTSGFGIGTDKMKIADHYENHDMMISPSVMMVENEKNSHVLYFTLSNDKVTSVAVNYKYVN